MIRTEALSFTYPNGIDALFDIDLEVKRGELLALVGANGCGKTTLLKHFIKLLKPSSGYIYLDDKELWSLKNEEIFRQVGMVFQDPNDQLFATTVEQDVSFGLMNLGLSRDEVNEQTLEALELTGISKIAGRAIHTLSFGQKRRAAIAGVLAMEPGVILLDEPTSGLDPRGTSVVMRLLRQLNREKGITMIMATHDIELVPLFCDRVVIMNSGRITKCDTPAEIFNDISAVRNADLRLPRIAHLAEIMQKRNGVHFENMPLTIGQARRELLAISRENGVPEGLNRFTHENTGGNTDEN